MSISAAQVAALTESGGSKSTEAKRQTEAMIRAANVVAENCGLPIGPSKVSKLVRMYQRNVEYKGVPFFDFFANAVELSGRQRRDALNNPDVMRVIAYADPTGETAVNNVLRERSATRRNR